MTTVAKTFLVLGFLVSGIFLNGCERAPTETDVITIPMGADATDARDAAVKKARNASRDVTLDP